MENETTIHRPSASSAEESAEEAAAQLDRATAASKCSPCGCFHDTLKALDEAQSEGTLPARLASAILKGKAALAPRKYDCLGCEVCYPALAVNALNGSGTNVEIAPCPTEPSEARAGWPPLPGDYTVARYRAPVAVCTLNAEELLEPIARSGEGAISIVGTLHTENLGIERVITNVLANPNIRFLVLCGADSRQTIGHLPGQSLLSLARAGIDQRGRIVGSKGKRPTLKNIGADAVEHFRRTVEIVDLIGEDVPDKILGQVRACAARDPGPADPFPANPVFRSVTGYLPERMIGDPAGYFVIFVDRARGRLLLEHFATNGVLDTVIEGRAAAELYLPATEKGLVSRLDHAAYLGQELARAEAALLTGAEYVQDGAPERRRPSSGAATSCSCGHACSEDSPPERSM